MVPSYFTALDEFPYTPNGKIDKNSLPIPSGVLQNEKVGYIAPKTDLEVKLASIWEEVLNTKPIGIRDNFFELGGDSLLAIKLQIETKAENIIAVIRNYEARIEAVKAEEKQEAPAKKAATKKAAK